MWVWVIKWFSNSTVVGRGGNCKEHQNSHGIDVASTNNGCHGLIKGKKTGKMS